MKKRIILATIFIVGCVNILLGQTTQVHGTVKVDNTLQEFVSVYFKTDKTKGVLTNSKGQFLLENMPVGTYEIAASMVGYKEQTKTIYLDGGVAALEVNFEINESLNILDGIVITGTKTNKRQTNSPVIVNVIQGKTLDNVQACNLSEGLKFQPGLRVETNCQTCNYTQLRMNGLAGGYSQILINGRPIFSPLTGLYGLEQLPTNMIDRIEVVRGGGSSLYGSSAIGGTVNIITKVPKENTYELNSFIQRINKQGNDAVISGNASLVSEKKNSGVSFFFNHRERDFYDHNNDNFSEIPLIENTSFGTNIFILPNDNQKIELSLSNLNEYRFGGEISTEPAYLTLQSEERTHNVWMGSADYQINFLQDDASIISYVAFQNTKRRHYTGIFPDDSASIQAHLLLPPYGTSNTTTFQGGIQLNYKFYNFISGTNTFTLGSEYVMDAVFDKIATYNYLIDQTTKDFGLFLQSDWKILRSLILLSGVRMDKHNMVGNLVFSPRLSLLYKYKTFTQLRLNYGTGFRAPQAFDTDLHIAFAAGGVSRVFLSPSLFPEKSNSYSASINFDKPKEHYIFGFTLEGFQTRLNDVFYLQHAGKDKFGVLFEKKNGQGAVVKGITLEARANYDKKAQLEAGFTVQSSRYDDEVINIEGLPGSNNFTRTPTNYGFATLTLNPNKKITSTINYIYTGEMDIPHFAGASNQSVDEIITSKPFSELSAKFGYTFEFKKTQTSLELYGGVKNIFNSFQGNFDMGKNRDSNFVFGPSLPRILYIGAKWRPS